MCIGGRISICGVCRIRSRRQGRAGYYSKMDFGRGSFRMNWVWRNGCVELSTETESWSLEEQLQMQIPKASTPASENHSEACRITLWELSDQSQEHEPVILLLVFLSFYNISST